MEKEIHVFPFLSLRGRVFFLSGSLGPVRLFGQPPFFLRSGYGPSPRIIFPNSPRFFPLRRLLIDSCQHDIESFSPAQALSPTPHLFLGAGPLFRLTISPPPFYNRCFLPGFPDFPPWRLRKLAFLLLPAAGNFLELSRPQWTPLILAVFRGGRTSFLFFCQQPSPTWRCYARVFLRAVF